MKTLSAYFKQLFKTRGTQHEPHPQISLKRIASYEEYLQYAGDMQQDYAQRQAWELNLIPETSSFSVSGHCYVCQQPTGFLVDFQYAYQTIKGKRVPNWRERLICPSCGLNNRLRASIHLFEHICHPKETDRIYVTEQVTPFYQWVHKKYCNTIGSEYLGEATLFGQENAAGIRNEDLTHLTFHDNVFNHILSFDVFEHIPNYLKALEECYRCLRPGGHLLFSVPFLRNTPHILARSRVLLDGSIEHMLPPEYHGNPVDDEHGSLCFYHFAWDLLAELKTIGFQEATALLYWSQTFGYLGGEQILFLAQKQAIGD
jgi:SAM-dependent methyltransferase